MAFYAGHDAAVLGQASLGNVHSRQQFYARRYRWRKFSPGRVRLLLQDAVYAIAKLEALLKGLNVNVGCGNIHGAMNNLIHQANDGGLTGEVFQVLNKFIIALARKAIPKLIILSVIA